MKSAGKCWGSAAQELAGANGGSTCRAQSKPPRQPGARPENYWPEPPSESTRRSAASIAVVAARARRPDSIARPGGWACPSPAVQLAQLLQRREHLAETATDAEAMSVAEKLREVRRPAQHQGARGRAIASVRQFVDLPGGRVARRHAGCASAAAHRLPAARSTP